MKRSGTRLLVALSSVLVTCAIGLGGASAKAAGTGAVRWEGALDASRCEGAYVSCTATWTGRKTTAAMSSAAALTPTTPPAYGKARGLGALTTRIPVQNTGPVTVRARIRIVHAEAVRPTPGLTRAAVFVALWTKSNSCYGDAEGSTAWCDRTAIEAVVNELDAAGARDGEVVELTTVVRPEAGDTLHIEPILETYAGPAAVTTPSCDGNFIPADGGGLCDATISGVADVPARAQGEVVVESLTLTYG